MIYKDEGNQLQSISCSVHSLSQNYNNPPFSAVSIFGVLVMLVPVILLGRPLLFLGTSCVILGSAGVPDVRPPLDNRGLTGACNTGLGTLWIG